MFWPIHFKFSVWIIHGERNVPFENKHQVVSPGATMWRHLKTFLFDNSRILWLIHLKFCMWIAHGQRKVPLKNMYQVVPSENGFHAITWECFDRFTSNLMCGLLMERGMFLSKTSTRCYPLVPPCGTIQKQVLCDNSNALTDSLEIWCVHYSWTGEGLFKEWHHLKMVSLR